MKFRTLGFSLKRIIIFKCNKLSKDKQQSSFTFYDVLVSFSRNILDFKSLDIKRTTSNPPRLNCVETREFSNDLEQLNYSLYLVFACS